MTNATKIVNILSSYDSKSLMILLSIICVLIICCVLVCVIDLLKYDLCCFRYDRYRKSCICKYECKKCRKNDKIQPEINNENSIS